MKKNSTENLSTGKKIKIAITVVLSVAVFIAFLLSPLFNFKSIEVVGNEYYTEDEILSSLGQINNKNYFILLFKNTPFSHLDYMFKGRMFELEQQLIVDKPYLKSVEVSFMFPMKGAVKVEERNPAFLTREGEIYLLVDAEGVVIETFTEENKPEYPVIEGLDTTGYSVGGSLVGKGLDEQLDLAMRICSSMKQIGIDGALINIVDVSNPERIWMFVKPSLSICIGENKDLNVKLSVLKEIFNAGYNGESDGIIDFTNGKNPIFKKNDPQNPEPDTGVEQDMIIDIENVLNNN